MANAKYRLTPLKERMVGYLETVGGSQVSFEGTFDEATKVAVELLYSNRDFLEVEITKIGKTVMASKKVGKVTSQGVFKYGLGGALIFIGLGVAGVMAYNSSKNQAPEGEYKVKLYKKGTLQDTIIFSESYVDKATQDFKKLGYVVRVAKIKTMAEGGNIAVENAQIGKTYWKKNHKNKWTEYVFRGKDDSGKFLLETTETLYGIPKESGYFLGKTFLYLNEPKHIKNSVYHLANGGVIDFNDLSNLELGDILVQMVGGKYPYLVQVLYKGRKDISVQNLNRVTVLPHNWDGDFIDYFRKLTNEEKSAVFGEPIVLNKKYMIEDLYKTYSKSSKFEEGEAVKVLQTYLEKNNLTPIQRYQVFDEENLVYDTLDDNFVKTSYYKKNYGKSYYQKLANGGGVDGEVYIEFLNKDKGFKKDVKHFNSYEEAVKWGRENFDNFNSDMIHYKMAKGGGVVTYKNKYNKKYGYDKNESHSLEDIARDTKISTKGLQQIYNKGIGAYNTNPQSVRPNVKSEEQWAMARVYSAVMGGKASKVDENELKMVKGGGVVDFNNFSKTDAEEYLKNKGYQINWQEDGFGKLYIQVYSKKTKTFIYSDDVKLKNIPKDILYCLDVIWENNFNYSIGGL